MLDKDLLTVDEVAEILRTTPNTIYRWLRSGKMAGVKIGKEWRIKKENLQAMLSSHKNDHKSHDNYLDKINPKHDHVLGLAKNADDLYDLEADYLQKGLSMGHRLFKGCWWQHPDDVRVKLANRGLPVQRLESDDTLIIIDLHKHYKRKGISEPVKVWTDEAMKTVSLGYSTMWGSGSPHLLACDGDVSSLISFENLLDKALKDLPVVGICPYIVEECMSDFFTPFVELANHHRSVIFYDANNTIYLKHLL